MHVLLDILQMHCIDVPLQAVAMVIARYKIFILTNVHTNIIEYISFVIRIVVVYLKTFYYRF